MATDLTRDPRDANAGVSDLETPEFDVLEFGRCESESKPGDGRRRIAKRTIVSS